MFPSAAETRSLVSRHRRLIRENTAGATAFPDPSNNTISQHDLTSTIREWTSWMMTDDQRTIRESRTDLKHFGEVKTELGDVRREDETSQWSAWEQWHSLQARDNKLLLTLVPIPMSMILIFLAISWYRRRQTSAMRRRQRHRHLIELDLIRRQLAPGLGEPRVELLSSEPMDSVQDVVTYNPPPYSEALDTGVYPLVLSTAGDPPPYCKVIENGQVSEQTRKHTQHPDTAIVTPSLPGVVPSAPYCIAEENQNESTELPPPYSDTYPQPEVK